MDENENTILPPEFKGVKAPEPAPVVGEDIAANSLAEPAGNTEPDSAARPGINLGKDNECKPMPLPERQPVERPDMADPIAEPDYDSAAPAAYDDPASVEVTEGFTEQYEAAEPMREDPREGYISTSTVTCREDFDAYGFIPVSQLPYRGNGYKTGIILLMVGIFVLSIILYIAGMVDVVEDSLSSSYYYDSTGSTFKELFITALPEIAIGLCVLIAFKTKFWAVRNRVFRGVDYVQADLDANDGYPFVMTNGYFGVFNTEARRLIIKPEWDSIRWYPTHGYFECSRDGETRFFSTRGREMR